MLKISSIINILALIVWTYIVLRFSSHTPQRVQTNVQPTMFTLPLPRGERTRGEGAFHTKQNNSLILTFFPLREKNPLFAII